MSSFHILSSPIRTYSSTVCCIQYNVVGLISFYFFSGCSKFGRFHANQGFILFLLEIACSIACALLGWIPLVGWIIKTVLGLAVTILMVIGIVNAATGKAKELPFIGGLMHVFK